MANPPRHMSPIQIAEHADLHRIDSYPFDSTVPIDFSKPFICPSLTALYYTTVWQELSPDDQLRHTQLSALSFNELIAWFEGGFSSTLLSLSRSERVPKDLRAILPDFIEDERRRMRPKVPASRRVGPEMARSRRSRSSTTRTS